MRLRVNIKKRLFGFVEFRTLVAIIGAIVVHLDFYVGFYEDSCLREAEFEILDGQSAVDPLLFVVGSNTENVWLLPHFRSPQAYDRDHRCGIRREVGSL